MTLAKPQVRGSTIDIANWAIYYYAKVERQIKGFAEYFTQEINFTQESKHLNASWTCRSCAKEQCFYFW